jgi:F-type H+-transporting ATPase subunit c
LNSTLFSKGEISVAKYSKWISLSMLVLFALATPVFAQAAAGATPTYPVVDFSKFFGAGLTTMGAAYGIGKLASSALEGMARQPEVAGSIQTAMIIAAALIEGFTFFALFICFQG